MEDKKYTILSDIKKINEEHNKIKEFILSQLIEVEKIEENILNGENRLLELEKKYVELVEILDNIVNG